MSCDDISESYPKKKNVVHGAYDLCRQVANQAQENGAFTGGMTLVEGPALR